MPDGCQRKTEYKKSTDAAKRAGKKTLLIAKAHLSCFIRFFSAFSAGLEVVNWMPVVDL